MHPDVGREQAYFDRARALRDRRRAEAEAEDAFGTGAGTVGQLGRLLAPFPQADPDSAVAFGRIDAEGDTFYIGRDAVWDDDSEMVVVNWQAPIAAPFYRATADEPEGLAARRVYRCADDRILDIDELVFEGLATAAATGSDPVVSDALLDALAADRAGELHDIVATIQQAQYDVITQPIDQLLVVQGGPGTGKTQVGLHRVSWLLHNHADRLGPGDVLVVGPNPAFVRYIAAVLPALGEQATVQQPITALGPPVRIGRTDPPELRRLKGDRRMLRLIVNGLRNLQQVHDDPVELAIGRRTVRLDGSRVAGRARQLSARTHNEAHHELRSFLLEEVRTRLTSRGGPDLSVDSVARAEATEAVDDYLYDAWPTLTPQAYLLDLLADPDQLDDAAAGLLTDDEMDLLTIPEDARVGVWQWSAHDVPMLDAADVLLNGAPATYEHIVVDEAQDLSPMQLEAVRRRSRTGSMTLLGDLAQATSPWARTSWEDVALHLRRDRVPTEIVELRTAYRLPAEVHEVAMRLLPAIAPDLTPPEPVRRTGHGVLVSRSHDLATATVETVRALAGGKAGLAAASAGPSSGGAPSPSETGGLVGVIVPARHRARVAAGMERAGLPWAPELRGGRAPIVLLSADAAKGLEFDNVVVVEPSQIMAESERGLRSLFIAMTRCTQRLALVHRDPLPGELGTIDPAPPASIPRSARTTRSARPAGDAAHQGRPPASGAPAPAARASRSVAGSAAVEPVAAAPAVEPAEADDGGIASSGDAADLPDVGPEPTDDTTPAPAAGPRERMAARQNDELAALLADIRATSSGAGGQPARSDATGPGGEASTADDATAEHPTPPPPEPDFGTPEVPLRWARAAAAAEGPEAADPSPAAAAPPSGAPAPATQAPARDASSPAAPSSAPAAGSPSAPADVPDFTGRRAPTAPSPAVQDRPVPPAVAASGLASASPAEPAPAGTEPVPGSQVFGGPAVLPLSSGAGWPAPAPRNDEFDPRETMPMGMAALDTGSLPTVTRPPTQPPPPPPSPAPIVPPSQPDAGPTAPPGPATVPAASPAAGQVGPWGSASPQPGEAPAWPHEPPPAGTPSPSPAHPEPWAPPQPATREVAAWQRPAEHQPWDRSSTERGELPAWSQAPPPVPSPPAAPAPAPASLPEPWGRPRPATGEAPAWQGAPAAAASSPAPGGEAAVGIPRRPVAANGTGQYLSVEASGPPVVEGGRIPDAYQRRFGDRRRYGDDRLAPGRPPEAAAEPADATGPSSSPYGAPRPAAAELPPPTSMPYGVARAPGAPGGAPAPTRNGDPGTPAPPAGPGEPMIGHGPLWASSPGQTAELRLAAALDEPAPPAPPTRPGIRSRVADASGPTPGPRLGNRLPAGAPSWLRGSTEQARGQSSESAREGADPARSTPAGRLTDDAPRGPVAYGAGRRDTAEPMTTGRRAAAPAGAGAQPDEIGGTRPGMPAAPGVGQGGPADRAGGSPGVGGASGADPARAPARGPATVDDEWSEEAFGQVDSIQVNAGTDRAPVDDAAPAWGAAFPEVSPAADWRTSIPREFVARVPGAPRRPARHERPGLDGPEPHDGQANGRSYPAAGGGYVPAGPQGAEAPGDPAVPTGDAGTGTDRTAGAAPVPGSAGSPRPYETASRSRQDSATAQATQAHQPTPLTQPSAQGRETRDRPSLYSHGDRAGQAGGPPFERPSRPRGDDLTDGHRPAEQSARPAAAEPTAIPRVPYTTRSAGPAPSMPAPTATATRVNGAPGVNGVPGMHGPAPTGHELVLAEPDPAAGAGGTTGTTGTADVTGTADATGTTGGALRPHDATGPWNELDREIARAVAATLAGKLARYVNPNLLPLVAEELGRNISPDGPRPGDPAGPSGARPA